MPHKLTVALIDSAEKYQRYLEPVLRKIWPHELVIHSSLGRASDLVFFCGAEVPKMAGKKVLIWTQSAPLLQAKVAADLVIDCKRLMSTYVYLPRYVLHFAERYRNKPTDLLTPKQMSEISGKSKFCAYLYTKPNEAREALFRAIHSYKPVDALGKNLHNQNKTALPSTVFQQRRQPIIKAGSRQMSLPQPLPIASSAVTDRDLYVPGVRSYLDSAVQKYQPYKFVIVCEHAVVPGFITENLISAMLAHCIPIYFGAADVVSVFNPRAFINASSFPDVEAVAKYVAKMDSNPKLYESMFLEPWFRKPDTLPDFFQSDYLAPYLQELLAPSTAT